MTGSYDLKHVQPARKARWHWRPCGRRPPDLPETTSEWSKSIMERGMDKDRMAKQAAAKQAAGKGTAGKQETGAKSYGTQGQSQSTSGGAKDPMKK